MTRPARLAVASVDLAAAAAAAAPRRKATARRAARARRSEGGAGAQHLAGAVGGEELGVVKGRGEVAGALKSGEEVRVAAMFGELLSGDVSGGTGIL